MRLCDSLSQRETYETCRPTMFVATYPQQERRGLLPDHRFGGQRVNLFDDALDTLLRRPET